MSQLSGTPGPVVIRAEEEWPICCKDSVKEVVEGGALDRSVFA